MNALYKTNKEAGFSLVELMIVVGIIGLLATLAIPRFQQFQAKAKMAEAKTTLSHLYTLQEAYHLDNNVYLALPQVVGYTGAGWNCANAAATTLGFEIQPCGATSRLPRFGYSVPTASTTAFQGRAVSGAGGNNLVCPNKGAVTFTINQNRDTTGPSACP